MTTARWYAKADALSKAWTRQKAGQATKQVVEMALAVAQHETLCGDAWPGEHNWGACTLRPLNASELACLAKAGVHAPPPGTTLTAINKATADARAALASAGLTGPDRGLHWDCTPVAGYFTWFAAYPDDAGGAEYFVKVLAVQRPTCATQLRSGTLNGLASAMYYTHYYTGIHDHNPEANIADYDRALEALYPGIVWALSTWYEGSTSIPPEPATIQKALISKGFSCGPSGADGVPGRMTRAALGVFQTSKGLPNTGYPDAATLRALGFDSP